jgi:hypothetical protein
MLSRDWCMSSKVEKAREDEDARSTTRRGVGR